LIPTETYIQFEAFLYFLPKPRKSFFVCPVSVYPRCRY